MKLVSLNLFGYNEWEDRKEKIVKFLNEIDADAVCFQEVKFDSAVSPFNQSDYLNRKLTNPFGYSSSSITKFYRPRTSEPFREGLAVLSRYPIIHSESLVLYQAEDDKHARIIQNIDLDFPGEALRLSNVHFSNNAHSAEQLKETLSILAAIGDERIILGDFNIFELSEHRAEYEDKYQSSIEFAQYISYPSENHTLDYVLLPNKYKYESLNTREGLSDHNALVVEFS